MKNKKEIGKILKNYNKKCFECVVLDQDEPTFYASEKEFKKCVNRLLALQAKTIKEVCERIKMGKMQDMYKSQCIITGNRAIPIPNSDRTKGYNQAVNDFNKKVDEILEEVEK